MATAQANGYDTLENPKFEDFLGFAGDASGPKRGSALSNKLISILSSSYADNETRDALRLLDKRGAQNASETRFKLKTEAQKEVIEANSRIVDDFGKVAKQLQRVGAMITILNQTCDEMRSHIRSAKQETAPMLEEASTLLARKEETESKQQLLETFNTHFLLSDEDLTTLTSSAEPVNDRYFIVLDQVKGIHKECETLLGYENQRLGMELMEQTTRHLDAGYKKLYSWIQREFKDLDLEDPRTSASIRRSLKALSERPTLFQNCLDFFGEARKITLSEAFQKALTDSTIGAAKAIEFSTHDPLRYIGDMLAWVHSTTVSEKEALEGLFIADANEISRRLQAGKSTEPWARLRRTTSEEEEDDDDDDGDDDDEKSDASANDEVQYDGHAALNSLISRNMAVVSQILSQRVSLTIRNLTDSLAVYKAYNLLLFYEDIFVKLLGNRASHILVRNTEEPQYRSQDVSSHSLLEVLSVLQTQALTTFTNYAKEEIESIPSIPDSNLSPPAILSTNLGLLSSILQLRSVNLTRNEFGNLYTVLLSPILSVCTEIAESLDQPTQEGKPKSNGENGSTESDQDSDTESLPSFESLIYTLNYLHPILTTLTTLSQDQAVAEHLLPPLHQAQSQVPIIEVKLVALLTDSFLDISSLDFLLSFLTSESNRSVLVVEKRRWLLKHLEECSAALDTFLAGAVMDAQEDVSKLSDKDVGKKVIAEAVEGFCVEFERAVEELEALDDEWEKVRINDDGEDNGTNKNGRADSNKAGTEGNVADDAGNEHALLRELYPRTVDEVRALLS